MTTATHPVAIPEWMPGQKRLPKHSLCVSHVMHNGKRACLPVPEREAAAYLRERDRFAAYIERVMKARAKRPRPIGDGRDHSVKRGTPRMSAHSASTPSTRKFWRAVASTKRHRHSKHCLKPAELPYRDTTQPEDLGWLTCTALASAIRGRYELHTHRTKRGRAFLIGHMRGDPSCPDVAARRAVEAAELAIKLAEQEANAD